MSTERIRVALPYTANVVPRGARNGRNVVFRTEAVVDVRAAAASAVAPAVEVTRPDNARTWYGHAGHLWLPLTTADGAPCSVEAFTAGLADGAKSIGDRKNPFMDLGFEASSHERFLDAGTIEEMPIRSVLKDDRAEKQACATRAALDYLLLDDGRVMHRAPGPKWACRPKWLDLVRNEDDHDLQHLDVRFNVLRRIEAEEFVQAEWGSDWRERYDAGFVVIHQPEHVADDDALQAVRSVANYRALQWMAQIARIRPRIADELQPTFEAVERLYGRSFDRMTKGTQVSACPGAAPAADEDVLAVVEGIRSFFAASSRTRIGGTDTGMQSLQNLFETVSGMHLRRFDVHEYDRLGASVSAPDLDMPPAFGSQP